MARYTVTKGNTPDDAVTFDTDDARDIRVDTPYHVVHLNFVISREQIDREFG